MVKIYSSSTPARPKGISIGSSEHFMDYGIETVIPGISNSKYITITPKITAGGRIIHPNRFKWKGNKLLAFIKYVV
jgi:hypothetical protein